MFALLARTDFAGVCASNVSFLRFYPETGVSGHDNIADVYPAELEHFVEWRILEGICRPPILVMVETERQLRLLTQ